MSIRSMFTATPMDATDFQWDTTAYSDPGQTQFPDTGHNTYKLGYLASEDINPMFEVATYGAASGRWHMGTWVSEVMPYNISIPAGATIGFTNVHGYSTNKGAGVYLDIKVSVVKRATPPTGDYVWDRTLIDWTQNALQSFSDSQGNAGVYGAGTQQGVGNSFHVQFPSLVSLLQNERLAIEIGMNVTGSKTGAAGWEFGDITDDYRNAASTISQTYGNDCVLPINLDEANQDALGHSEEILIPWIPGTDLIAWADVGDDWSSTKWEDPSPGSGIVPRRYVSRANGAMTCQFWIFQDDDFLYCAMNNLIDGCIQQSDHMSLFLCISQDWSTALMPDEDDWMFRRDIRGGKSSDRVPLQWVTGGDSLDDGELIFRGAPNITDATTYPYGWVQSVIAGAGAPGRTDRFDFSGDGYSDITLTDGTDYRMGGPGATSTAPATAPAATGGAYSEFKIRKSKIEWDGLVPIGIMVVTQCDIQANGHTIFPTTLGNQVDLKDWNYPGWWFPEESVDLTPSSNSVAPDDLDLRPLMSVHAQTQFGDVGPQQFAEGTVGTMRIYSAETSGAEDTALYEEVPQVIRDREGLT